MQEDYEIRGEFQENYRYAHDYWSPFVKDAEVYTLAASGYTWTWDERKALIKEGREPLELNIMRRPIQFFSGYLRDNLHSIIAAPVEGSDQKTADQLTKLGYYVWDKGQGYSVFLDACDEMLKSGISLCGIQKTYDKDFINGDISFFKRTYNSFYLDPTFEHLDLSDCGFAIMRDLLNRVSIKSLLPFVDPKQIDEITNSFRDDKFLSFHPNFTTLSRNRNLMAYDQYYKRVTKKREFLIDMNTSYYRDITELSKEEKDKLKFGLNRLTTMKRDADVLGIDREAVPNVEIRKVDRPFVELNIMLNGERVYTGDDKTGINETYPFVPIVGYFEPSIWIPSQRVQGIAAGQYFNQRQFNKRHMKIVDMMDSTISTGFKYLIGAVADVSDLQQSGQNKIIGVDPENAPQGLDSVQQLQGGNANPALIEYQAILDKLSLTLANVNESVLGVDEKGNTQVSGRLAEVRIGQGLRSNRKIFDNIEQSQQILGGLVFKGIQLNYPAGKVERILAEPATDQFYENQFEQYDAVIKEGVRTKSQRDAYYYEIVNLKREGIVDVPQAEIIRALQMAGLSDLEEAIKTQSEQQAQVQAEAHKMQMELLNAQKEEKLGLAKERDSRVVSNLALKDERESEAQQNMAQASLDRSRAISEISKLNEDRILRVLAFVNEIEREEAEGRELQKTQVAAQAQQINADVIGTEENQAKQQQEQMMQQAQLQQQSQINQGGLNG